MRTQTLCVLEIDYQQKIYLARKPWDKDKGKNICKRAHFSERQQSTLKSEKKGYKKNQCKQRIQVQRCHIQACFSALV